MTKRRYLREVSEERPEVGFCALRVSFTLQTVDKPHVEDRDTSKTPSRTCCLSVISLHLLTFRNYILYNHLHKTVNEQKTFLVF